MPKYLYRIIEYVQNVIFIRKMFLKCCLSNAKGGMQDDTLWDYKKSSDEDARTVQRVRRNIGGASEVCNPRCEFKLLGEVNTVKDKTMNIWLNDGIRNGKTTCFGLQRPSTGFDNFLAIRVIYNMYKPRGDVEIASSFACAC